LSCINITLPLIKSISSFDCFTNNSIAFHSFFSGLLQVWFQQISSISILWLWWQGISQYPSEP
jgi:hypothetical protein